MYNMRPSEQMSFLLNRLSGRAHAACRECRLCECRLMADCHMPTKELFGMSEFVVKAKWYPKIVVKDKRYPKIVVLLSEKITFFKFRITSTFTF